ncbi:unnamed protein product [Acanthoscelides obtectus]|uniref:Uncharacterized protein n=1 Tax=Acanthoscelides obtectus TaxID=200917 RepID=A0A9P0M8M6_ACAOB|nr:unnamed protein product [Acanthoscelides obtectus]CAK1624607.1 hypothetical protein AOBTE_LOCUS2641 [Acanthoscelides obtectus]
MHTSQRRNSKEQYNLQVSGCQVIVTKCYQQRIHQQKCIQHVIKEEQRMWDLDTHIDIIVEPVVIELNSDDSDSSSHDSDIE